MAQSGDHLRFALEARLGLRVPLDMTMHHFDDDETIQPEMCADIDFSHSPAGEFLFDAYVSNDLADPIWNGRIIQQPGKISRSLRSFEMTRGVTGLSFRP